MTPIQWLLTSIVVLAGAIRIWQKLARRATRGSWFLAALMLVAGGGLVSSVGGYKPPLNLLGLALALSGIYVSFREKRRPESVSKEV